MRNHDGCVRGFIRAAQAWYFESVARMMEPDITEEISFGLYASEGGTSGEMMMRWHKLGETIYPRLECYSDAWDALSTFADILPKLAAFDSDRNVFSESSPRMTPDQFCELLLGAGFEDMTKRERPAGY